MTTKLITEAVEQAIKAAGGAGGVAGNGINIKTFLDKTEDGDRVGMGVATIVRWALINQNNILKKIGI